MPFYLFQAAYKDATIKAMVDTPSNREQATRELCQSCGGKLHHWFMAFGEWDVVAMAEFPDNESAAAVVMRVQSIGGLSRGQTTVLFTAEEAERAMRKAKSTQTSFRLPSG
jgi:uncharacterized protein with GYD domain